MKSSYTFLLILFITLSGCQKQVGIEDLNNLNGYWEIDSVTTKEGKEIEFKFNESVDFFEIEGTKGIRTKVKPQLDGAFIKTNDAEGFTADLQNEKLFLHYETNFDAWDERILYLDNSKLITKNDQDITYTYRRFTGYLDKDTITNGKKK